MTEAVFNASGMGLPIVMTIASRAIGAPINIWNDQSDSLALRDSGWMQLFAMNNQEAADLHVIAFAAAEELGIPAMVCMDGFVLTHASDVVEVPDAETIDAYLPPFVPKQSLDVAHPATLGTMAGPEAFTETKYLQHHRFLDATGVVAAWSAKFTDMFGREAGGLVHSFDPDTLARDRTAPPPEPDDVVVVAMGSVLGTLQDTLTALRADGVKVRLVGIGTYRPFPAAAVQDAVGMARTVVVIDRALELGVGGVLTGDIRHALAGRDVSVHSVVTGLGGRPIRQELLAEVIRRAVDQGLPDLEFCDLHSDVLTGLSS